MWIMVKWATRWNLVPLKLFTLNLISLHCRKLDNSSTAPPFQRAAGWGRCTWGLSDSDATQPRPGQALGGRVEHITLPSLCFLLLPSLSRGHSHVIVWGITILLRRTALKSVRENPRYRTQTMPLQTAASLSPQFITTVLCVTVFSFLFLQPSLSRLCFR